MGSFITSVLAGLLGAGGGSLMTWMLFPQTKQAKVLENEAKQSEEWKKLYIEAKSQLDSKDAKIDSLYADIAKHRDEKAVLRVRNTELEVENAKLNLLKCKVPECNYRDPQSGY